MHADSSARPTVGREAEVEELEAALDALAQAEAVCVALEGEPGIGKTRLLAELRRRAEDRGCLALAGSATEFERDLPFSVWVDALDAYVASQELSLHEAWDAEAVGELAEILPSLRGAAVRQGGSRTSATAPTVWFAGCSSCSRAIGRWSWFWTTCIGATARRSSCSERCFGAARTLPSCLRSPIAEGRHLSDSRPRSLRRRCDGLHSSS